MSRIRKSLTVLLVCTLGLVAWASYFRNDMKEMFFSSSNSLRSGKQRRVASTAEATSPSAAPGMTLDNGVADEKLALLYGSTSAGGPPPADPYEPESPPPQARHATHGGWPPDTSSARSGEKPAERDFSGTDDLESFDQARGDFDSRREAQQEGKRDDDRDGNAPDMPHSREPGPAPPSAQAPIPGEPSKDRGESAGARGRKQLEQQPAAKKPQSQTELSTEEALKESAARGYGDSEKGAGLHAERVKVAPPVRYLPRSAYFENTYLGGNAAVAERQYRLDRAWGSRACPYRLATLGPQAFDPPASDGLALFCSLDRTWAEKPGRVMLQIGLRGSERYGWRRPPLDIVVVVDPAVFASGRAQVKEALVSLVRQLGPQDKVGLTLASNPPRELARPQRLRDAKASLAEHLAQLPTSGSSQPEDLAAAFELAGARLSAGSGSGVPGTQTVLFIAGPPAQDRVRVAGHAAHALSLRGIVTSVLELGGGPASEWWSVAHAGQGNHHRVQGAQVEDAVATELASLARVVARLARVNIRLGPDTKAIRILGSRILSAPEVKEVKDREVATDRQLSRSLGVASDRGDDDDGLQTVIPYFLGGDAHVILVELMVDRPGTVAEVSVRYKDMVRLTNAQIHATVALGHAQRAPTGLQAEVEQNTARFLVAERLQWAAYELQRGTASQAMAHLSWAARSVPAGTPERRMVDELSARVGQEGRAARVIEAIGLAADRLVGQSPAR